jgi:hypothetical protein
VPQHKWLWSPLDEAARHQRRYNAAELYAKVEVAGFRIARSTSFVTLLLPLMLASRLAMRRTGQVGGAEAMVHNRVLDQTLAFIMRTEHLLIRIGVPLPFGGSRLLVCTRKDLL